MVAEAPESRKQAPYRVVSSWEYDDYLDDIARMLEYCRDSGTEIPRGHLFLPSHAGSAS